MHIYKVCVCEFFSRSHKVTETAGAED